VALTASAFEHDREAILEAGCDDFVPKPYRAATLFAKMTELLGVRFRTDAQASGAPAPGLETAGLAALEARHRASLEQVVMQGDVEGAHVVIDEIGALDPALARTLRALVRGYRFDELQAALDRAGR
jgi:DNA-binding response OmpR family regulator